ncbi:MAG: Uma2 family endonuclease [Verrucomicrobia bacterium]|nr:Uma2 family endonuclease [Verrucomicrobiota bacterium]
MDDFARSHPTTAELAVEICVTSHDYDRDKLAAYARAGVKEAWLVLGPERQVAIYRRPEAGHYAESIVLPHDGILASTALPGVSVRLLELFRV